MASFPCSTTTTTPNALHVVFEPHHDDRVTAARGLCPARPVRYRVTVLSSPCRRPENGHQQRAERQRRGAESRHPNSTRWFLILQPPLDLGEGSEVEQGFAEPFQLLQRQGSDAIG